MQADRHLDGDDLGQPRLADRGAQAAVDAGGGQRQDEVDRVGDLQRARSRAVFGPTPSRPVSSEKSGKRTSGRLMVAASSAIPAGCQSAQAEALSARTCSRAAGYRGASRRGRVASARASSRLARRRPSSSRISRWWCQTGTGSPRSACSSRWSGVGAQEIRAAHHVGDPLGGVVDDDREVVGLRRCPSAPSTTSPSVRASSRRVEPMAPGASGTGLGEGRAAPPLDAAEGSRRRRGRSAPGRTLGRSVAATAGAGIDARRPARLPVARRGRRRCRGGCRCRGR